MTYQFGKAVSGGTPLSDGELRTMETDRLHALYTQLSRPAPTADLLDQRLAQELDYAERLLAMTESELKRRGGVPQLVRQLADAKTVVGDVAGVVGAQDRCEGVARASDELKRRLLRDVGEDEEPPCRRARPGRG